MSFNNPVADVVTSIRNGYARGKKSIWVHKSKLIGNILSILVQEGFLTGFKEIKTESYKFLVDLKYYNGVSCVSKIRIRSKTTCHEYIKKDSVIRRLFCERSLLIVSNSFGVMTLADARNKARQGGEVLLEVC